MCRIKITDQIETSLSHEIQSRAISCPEVIINTDQTPSPISGKAESFPGLIYTGNRRRIGRKIKPKTRDDFFTGRIQGWTTIVSNKKNQGGQDHVQELGVGNEISDATDSRKKGAQGGSKRSFLDGSKTSTLSNKAELKVYSRRQREGLRKESIINEGDSSWFVEDYGGNHNSEYHTSSESQSLTDSTSEYLGSDGDLDMLAEMKTDSYRVVTEEDGLEGFRHLMGPIELSNDENINSKERVRYDGTCDKLTEGPKNIESTLLEGEGVQRRNDLVKEAMGYVSEGIGPDLKVGKVGLSWREIKEAMDSINLQLIENTAVKEGKVVQENKCRSAARKKRGERELHNLKWTIEYDKGGKGKGIEIDL